ncbi:MAG: hypothetical protein J6P03_00195 [Opitutales bacterium]|nr:hypothetical protein [Opitutales bacterium]
MKILPKICALAASALTCIMLAACGIISEAQSEYAEADKWTFGKDISLLETYADCIVLGDGESFLALSPKLQGRVLTSTFDGANGRSLGWYNRTLLANGGEESHLNIIGGEDYVWVGPEGSEYSLFFPEKELFIAQNWKIPAAFSAEPWKLAAKSKYQAKFEKQAKLKNAKGADVSMNVEREVSFVSKQNASKILGVEIPDSVKVVAFQSINKLTNSGAEAWGEGGALVNMSAHSCFNANKSTYAFVPYKEGDQKQLGAIISDPYNEPVGDRLSVAPEYVRLRVDGFKVGEIFMNQKRSKNVIASYDSERNILTIVKYLSPTRERKYLPALWKRAADVFDGEALSVFNNGPAVQGSFFSEKFFETTTYSPALALEPGKSQIHVQRVFHFQGSEYDLGIIAYKCLGLTINQLRP